MVQPASNTKTAIHASIATPVAEQLKAEAESRMLAPAFLIEKALEVYLPTLPALPGTDAATGK
jgi:hypothetical protein